LGHTTLKIVSEMTCNVSSVEWDVKPYRVVPVPPDYWYARTHCRFNGYLSCLPK